MDNIQNRLKNLSPEKRALVEKHLRDKALQKAESLRIPIRKDKLSFPMSFDQERLWFLSNLNPDSPFYNIPAILKLNGKLNYSSLESSIKKVLDRHEVLNTVFVVDKGSPKQILSKKNYELQILNSEKINKDEFIRKELAEPFNLETGPLYKIRLLKVSENEHILVFILHHIVADGWSVTVLINEIINYYKNETDPADQILPPLQIQYFDYAEWQLESYKSGKFDKELEYWKSNLSNLPQTIDYPTDKKRPPVQTFNGERYEFPIDKEIIGQLKKTGQENKLSPFMIFYAAFEILLMRFCGEEDFAIGIPVANRRNDSVKNLVGFFVNTLAIRSTCSLDTPVNEYLNSIKNKILEAFENQNVPFEKVVEAVVPERSTSTSPLFQVMFDYQDSPMKQLRVHDLEIELLDIQMNTSKFDILLTVEERTDSVVASIEYNTDLFFKETIENLEQVYLKILSSISESNISKICDVNYIPENHYKCYKKWNDTETSYPKEKSVIDLFQETVEKYPEKTAITFKDHSLSYSEISNRANYLSSKLAERGVKKGSTVSVYLEQSPDMIIAFIAILKLGGVYLPIDISYPPDRIKFMLDDTNCKLIITDIVLNETITIYAAERIFVDELDYHGDQTHPQITENISPKDPAYIIYTSGSTGTPKGVIVPHQAIVRLVKDTNYIEIIPDDIIAQISNASFDAATFEIWGSLLNAATLSIIKKEKILSYESFYDLLRKYKISVLFITTSLFNQYAKFNNETFKTLRNIYFGGEISDPESVRAVYKNSPGLNIYHVYGPTESTTFTTYHLIGDKDFLLRSLPIGKPISNTTTYVVDINNKSVPIGFPGELLIGGDGLALGYFNRENLTDEKFIHAKHLGENRLYKSGDLVRFLPDGSIEFIGRKDTQIKLRGFRIELGEIESMIKKEEDIQDCAVIVHGSSSEDRKLVAYYVSKDSVSEDKLKNSLMNSLPEYMIPSIFVAIPKIPVTPNGKLDRKTLSKLLVSSTDRNRKYVAPRNSLEKYLVDLWKDVLDLEKVGVYDNFFEIGGNSLKAAVLMNRIEQDFKTSAHIAAVFKAPYIGEFANYVAEYYPEIIADRFSDASYKSKAGDIIDNTKIDSEKIDRFRSLIKSNKWKIEKDKNKRAIFILSPPRSGSTLLRVMLAGNNTLFSPPELDLLSFEDLTTRKKFFNDNNLEIWNESTIRAVMELRDCNSETAIRIMDSYEEKNFSTLDFFAEIQNWAGERIVVDKTPSYSIDINILNRIEEEFKNPLFIHLVRNPYPMIYSFIEAKLDQHFFKYENPFTRQELAELIWLISHQNILQLKKRVSNNRFYQIKFEDLIVSPKEELLNLCNFLNIEFDEEMLKPYSGRKMTTGITAEKQMVGDFKFYLRNKIDTRVIDKWKSVHKENFLSDESTRVAEDFGYKFDDIIDQANDQYSEIRQIQKIDRNRQLALSSAQKRLWFLEQLEGPSANYNIVNAIEIAGEFNLEIAEKCLNDIIDRHEVFRTKFITVDGKPVAEIFSSEKKNIKIIDLTKKDKTDDIKKIMFDEATSNFDISKPPLFRFTFVKLEHEKYIFILTLHHIISDGWSMGIIIKEFTELYEAYTNNRSPELLELPVQYLDYANWHNLEINSDKYKRKLEYWKVKLEGLNSLVTFPPDLPRPAEQRHRGNRTYFDLDQGTYNKIKDFAKNEDVTPYIILLSAFSILLARYSGQNDLPIGTPVAGRNRKEIESLIGFFVNTAILRINVDDNKSFIDLLNSIKSVLIESFEHSDYPFEKLLELVDTNRNMSYSPIFQTMFAYNDTTLEGVDLSKLHLKPLKLDTKISKFDITLELIERKNDFKVALEYNTDLYNEKSILNIIKNYKQLLHHYLRNPNENLGVSSIISNEEQRIVDEFCNGSSHRIDPDENFVRLFENQVSVSAENNAVVMDNRSIKFSELNSNANKLANFILNTKVDLKIESERPIAILLDRSFELIESILAVLKTGHPYLPIDPDFPQNRIDYILDDSESPLVITSSKYKHLFEKKTIKTIYIDSEKEIIDKYDSMNPNRPIFSENLAYIIYTSGSTGNPKGVAIQHFSVINLYKSLNDRIYKNFGSNKVSVSLNAPIQFDASVQQLVQLLSGHTLVIIPQEVKNDIELFNEYLKNHKIDVLDCVPTQLKLFINSGLFDKDYAPAVCLPGGEAIDQGMWNSCLNNKSTEFFNMYGPTEATVDITIQNISEENNIPSLGKCAYNSNIHILDKNLNKVPIGVTGEIYIEGSSLARGYFANPHRTAEVFIPNPFSENLGQRLYKTGDLGKYDHKGNLIYSGRSDSQIKLRGFRIELGEIESTLSRHESIKDSAVTLNQDSVDKIIAYVVADKEKINSNDLKKYLQSLLPEYMIPAGIMFIDEMPLTPNGKIDRKKLPKYEIDRSDLINEFKEPKTDKEIQLVEIWKKLLNIEKIGVEDNFFELGGDSILSIQLVSEARSKGILIKPKNVFQSPTIKGILSIAENVEEHVIEIGSLEGEFNLSPVQKWFFEQDFENYNHWNQSIILEITEKLDENLLRETTRILLENHDTLRMRFNKNGDDWIQYYSIADENIPFDIIDIKNSDKGSFEKQVQKEMNNVQASLNISEGPIFKIAYFTSNYKDYLLIAIHHLVVDSVSWRIITEDFQYIYSQLKSGNIPSLPGKTTHFSYWANNLLSYSNSDELLKQLDFWRDQKAKQDKLLNKPNLSFNKEESAENKIFYLDIELTEIILKEFPKEYNIEISDILLTALTIANSKINGSRKLNITLEGHGREDIFERVDLSRSVGWFTTLYPIVIDLAENISVVDCLKDVKKQLRSVPQNGIGYGVLKYNTNNKFIGDLPHLAEISFNYLGQFIVGNNTDSTFKFVSDFNSLERAKGNSRPFEMDIVASVVNGKLNTRFIYDKNQYSEDEIEKLGKIYIEEVKKIINESSGNLGKYAPSDFQDVSLDDEDFDNILEELD